MSNEFKTNDVNLAAFLMVYYQLIKCERSPIGNRITFFFTKTPQLQQKVFMFFSKQAECNISLFCDNLRALRAYLANV